MPGRRWSWLLINRPAESEPGKYLDQTGAVGVQPDVVMEVRKGHRKHKLPDSLALLQPRFDDLGPSTSDKMRYVN